jgi:hypothetical protein
MAASSFLKQVEDTMRNRHCQLALVTLLPLIGCGTIMHGPRQLVTVQSTPSGASLRVAPGSDTSSTTPVSLNLERKHQYTLTLASPGYTSATVELRPDVGIGTAFADGLFTGMIGLVVDALNGSLYGLNPESPNVTLSRTGASDSGPKEIHIRLLETDGGRHVKVQSDARVDVIVEICDSAHRANSQLQWCRDTSMR